MKDGYIKVAAATPKVKVADTVYNGQLIKALMKECTDNGAKVVVFRSFALPDTAVRIFSGRISSLLQQRMSL